MPELPPLKRDRLIKALKKLGFTVDKSKGKGSHYKVYPRAGLNNQETRKFHFFTVPKKISGPGIRIDLAKFLKENGVDIESFKKEL